MSDAIYWSDGVHGSCIPAPFYGLMNLIYWYALVVYWIDIGMPLRYTGLMNFRVFAYLSRVKVM